MLWQLVIADFRERTRRYSFLVTLTFVFFFGVLVITGKYGIFPSHCRGEFNSAWVGSTMAISAAAMIALVGFYLVKNSVRRDSFTGVGQILASSSLTDRSYLFAKFVSNVLALSVMAGLLIVAAVMMQLYGTMPWDLELWRLLAPFAFITFPIVILVSALAVLFESIRPLRGALGNIAYFFLLPLLLGRGAIDPMGFNLLITKMQAAALAAYPDKGKEYVMGFVGFAGVDVSAYPVFHWDGIDWTIAVIWPRLIYILVAVLIVVVAVPFFDRFDTRQRKRRVAAHTELTDEAVSGRLTIPAIGIAFVQPVTACFGFFAQFSAELTLLLKRVSWRWHIVALALLVAQLTVPYPILRSYILPAAWIWPLLIWSPMGAREKMMGTESLLFSSARPLSRQLPALWMAGVAVVLLTGSGALLRGLLGGDIGYVGTLLTAALFIPTTALALGILSGGSQLFEIAYVFIWYAGPINHIPALDFLGTTEAVVGSPTPIVFFAVTLVLLPILFLARRRQLGM
jgi:hypothetical protein